MTYVFNVFQYVQAPQRVLFSLLALPLRTPQPGVVPVTVSYGVTNGKTKPTGGKISGKFSFSQEATCIKKIS